MHNSMSFYICDGGSTAKAPEVPSLELNKVPLLLQHSALGGGGVGGRSGGRKIKFMVSPDHVGGPSLMGLTET